MLIALALIANLSSPEANAVRWLDERITPYSYERVYTSTGKVCYIGSTDEECLAVQSSPERYGRSYTYDAAVSVVALSGRGRFDEARGILRTLSRLMADDNFIGFSFNTIGDNFYAQETIRAGTIAWAGYAAAYYQRMSGDTAFQPMARRLASYLLAHQVGNPRDRRFGLITAGGDADWCATEHQIDAWFFLRELGPDYFAAAEAIRAALLARVWNEREGRFFMAMHPDGPSRSKALDVNSWGSIFLLAAGEKEKAARALAYAERTFRTTGGYKPYDGRVGDYPEIDWGLQDMVWGEGSLGMAVAYAKAGDREKAGRIIAEISTVEDKGGILYSTHALRDFPRSASVASTAWFLLVLDELRGASDFWS